ncbi:hypothetical protein LQ948_06455 [Jiella sp. MQZ9-1]|uniref:Uncharacterized protein n=1 Tax=Jiella flava TaxID=2816857 RepID=A0A939FZN3_9HYPH|nr:hypothetical protein [Jiella flava]MBO0662324.1 hypothetical protein [Jiella flava]MCD2470847.1 hypothetical protein [Jiella flava]
MPIQAAQNGDIFEAGEGVQMVEIELALGACDLGEASFEECVRGAAEMVGGELLFAMPADSSFEDASEIAAIHLGEADAGRARIHFVVLNAEGDALRVADRDAVGDRFYGFARAFVGLLSRIRDDLPFGQMEPEGTA